VNVLLLLIVAVFSLTLGCSSTPKHAPHDAKSVSGTDEQIFIGDTIEKNYDPNVIMKRAEAFFEKEDYSEAIIEYQHFLDLHRVHVLAPYAQFKLGESHFKIFKTVDRDPDPILKAQEAYEKLLRGFPGSRYQTEATQRIHECQDLMAQSYMFVGQFYYRRESYLAAAYRFESVLKKFPDMKIIPEALYYAALAYTELGAEDWAQEKLTLLAERYPDSPYVAESKKLLAKLNSKRPPQIAIAKVEIAPNGSGPLSQNGRAPVTTNGSAPITLTQPAVVLAQTAGLPPLSAVSAMTGRPTPTALAPQTTPCRLGAWC
jgi:outer membrane protein assembly factor BamD